MTKLHAFKTRLTCLLSGIEQQSLRVAAELNTLASQSKAYQQIITKASQPPLIVLPEVELSRRQFIAHQHHALESIMAQNKRLIAEQDALTSEAMRLKTQLALLDKYSEKQAKQAYRHYQQALQKNMDEWVLQGYLA